VRGFTEFGRVNGSAGCLVGRGLGWFWPRWGPLLVEGARVGAGCLVGLLVDDCDQLFDEPNSIEEPELEGRYEGFCGF
jgi:hypothetical protein